MLEERSAEPMDAEPTTERDAFLRQLPKRMAAIEDVCGSLDQQGSGLVVVLPIDNVYGYRQAES